MVQSFVKVDGSDAITMELELTDKVSDIVMRISSSVCRSKRDIHVTFEGRVLHEGCVLRNCGVGDGGTIQVTSRMRGGGKHNDKKNEAERKRDDTGQKTSIPDTEEPKSVKSPLNRESVEDAVIKHFQETEGNRKIIAELSEGSNVQMEQWIPSYRMLSGLVDERMKIIADGIRPLVEARSRGRGSGIERTTKIVPSAKKNRQWRWTKGRNGWMELRR